MSEVMEIVPPLKPLAGEVHIPGSKSISNRVLIIRALSGAQFTIENISDSDDTRVLKQALSSDGPKYDVGHAGTSFRFLAAYFAISEGTQVLTGSDRMKNRPIGPLVTALNEVGAEIIYLGKEGYPPVKICPFRGQKAREIQIDGSLSSQFVSALCLIAPALPQGLDIFMKGKIVSRPYVEMTLALMKAFGAEFDASHDNIHIRPSLYHEKKFQVESDWSAAGYFYGWVSLVKGSELVLSGFRPDSLQADSVIAEIGEWFGVKSSFADGKITISHSGKLSVPPDMDFLHYPDLAQTIAVMSAAHGVPLRLCGLDTLYHKETNRVKAIVYELSKAGVDVKPEGTHSITIEGTAGCIHDPIETYKDHRMAMAFSILGARQTVRIQDPQVVSKSYPGFWKDLERVRH